MEQTYILHIDTSSSICSVAISRGINLLAHEILEDAKLQSAQINALIDNCVQSSGIELKDLQAISICNGPGSYTGLRVGLSTAKGLCYALSIPLITHYKHDLISDNVSLDICYMVALLARKDEWFVAVYVKDKILQSAVHADRVDIMQYAQTYDVQHIITDDENFEIDGNIDVLKINIANSYKIENVINNSLSMYYDKNFADLAYVEPFYLKAAFTTQPKSNILHKNFKS